MLKIYKVSGQSMTPTLKDGAFVLCAKWPDKKLKVNDLVIINHPIYSHLIKRIVGINALGQIQIAGDNPESTKFHSWFPPKRVIGKVLLKFSEKS